MSVLNFYAISQTVIACGAIIKKIEPLLNNAFDIIINNMCVFLYDIIRKHFGGVPSYSWLPPNHYRTESSLFLAVMRPDYTTYPQLPVPKYTESQKKRITSSERH